MSERTKSALRIVGRILFVLYMIFLVWFLIITDLYGRGASGVLGDYRYNLQPFAEIRRFIVHRRQLGAFAVFTNLFGNILIFMPFGFFMALAAKRRNFFLCLFYTLGASLLVELFQLVSRVGVFDVDDLLLNTLGGALGYTVFVLCLRIRRRFNKDRGKSSG